MGVCVSAGPHEVVLEPAALTPPTPGQSSSHPQAHDAYPGSGSVDHQRQADQPYASTRPTVSPSNSRRVLELARNSSDDAQLDKGNHFSSNGGGGKDYPMDAFAGDTATVESMEKAKGKKKKKKNRNASKEDDFLRDLQVVEARMLEMVSENPILRKSNLYRAWNTKPIELGTIVLEYTVTRQMMPGYIGVNHVIENDRKEQFLLKNVSFADRDPLRGRVMHDLMALIKFKHENILKVCNLSTYDEGADDSVAVITRYMENGNIRKYAGNLADDPKKLQKILLDVASGLLALHSNRIAHCDLKLENVMELSNGSFAIADAGFSEFFANQNILCAVPTGELVYLPPESFTDGGNHRVNSPQSDMWGLGILMYNLAYGEPPFQVDNMSVEEIKDIVLTQPLTFPEMDWPFTNALNQVISVCLDRNPSNRPTVYRLMKMEFFSSGAPVKMLAAMSLGNLGRSMTSLSKATLTSNPIEKRHGFMFNQMLGKGKRSETYSVNLRTTPDKKFVLKVMRESLSERLSACTKYVPLLENLRIIAFSKKVHHPNVVANIEIIDNDEGSYLTQVLFDRSAELSTQVIPKIKSHLPKIFLDILSALVQMHGNDVYHLGINFNNVFLAEENCAALADYGPPFCTFAELLTGGPKGSLLYALPAHIERILNPKDTTTQQYVDTFAVGLMAASIEQTNRTNVWYQYNKEDPAATLDIDHIIKTLEKSEPRYPAEYVHFVKTALTHPTTAATLLKHPLFKGVVTPKHFEVERVKVTEEDIRQAVEKKFRNREESTLYNVLGYDTTTEETVIGMVMQEGASGIKADGFRIGRDGAHSDDPHNNPAQFVRVFNNPQCMMCKLPISLVLFSCLVCTEVVSCPKCRSVLNHNPAHEIIPFILTTVQYPDDAASKQKYYGICTIYKYSALERVERIESLPQGTLTSFVSDGALKSRVGGIVDRDRRQPSGSGALLRPNRYPGGARVSIQPGAINGMNGNAALDKPSSPQLLARLAPKNLMNGGDGGGWNGGPGALDTRGGGSPMSKDTSTSPVKSQSNMPEEDEDTEDMHPLLKSLRGANLQKKRKSKVDKLSMLRNPANSNTANTPTNAKSSNTLMGQSAMRRFPKESEFDDVHDVQDEIELCQRDKTSDLVFNGMRLSNVPSAIFSAGVFHITFLDLSNNQLHTLPNEIALFVHLEKLSVSENELMELPSSIGKLSNLEHLDASHNNLSDLPETMVQLHRIERIMADYNNFVEIPPCVFNMLSLRYFYLAENPRVTRFPQVATLQNVASVSLALDNDPLLVKQYDGMKDTIPNIQVMWNKIYPDEIIPGLFCGSLRSAQTQRVYERFGIQYVLTVAREITPNPPENGVHKTINVDDLEGATIDVAFKESVAFIDEAMENHVGCLVHCFAGMSRSATVVIAYLMMRRGMRLDEAYTTTRRGRPAIYPNAGFFRQLVQLDHALYPHGRQLDMACMEREKIPNS